MNELDPFKNAEMFMRSVGSGNITQHLIEQYEQKTGMAFPEHLKKPQTGHSGIATRCLTNISQEKDVFTPRHTHPARAVFSCDHCEHQDEKHPIGIILMPDMYYLCKWCFQRRGERDVKLFKELKIRCWSCILDETERLIRIDPALFKNLAGQKSDGFLEH